MQEPKRRTPFRQLPGIRIALFILTGLIGICWLSSYVVGFQRYKSDWSQAESVATEKARWLVSNYGSIGLAWRTQTGQLGSTIPPNEFDLKSFDSSAAALSNIHPTGALSWHWIHYQPAEIRSMGSMSGGYGHLYIPYWIPFLGMGLLALFLPVRIE